MEEKRIEVTPDGLRYVIGTEEEAMKYIGTESEPREQPYPVTVEHIEHFCEGIQDPNPVFWSDEFGKQTRWGGRIAPWGTIALTGEHRVWRPGWMEKKEEDRTGIGLTEVPLPGNRLLATNYETFCYIPFRPGDRMFTSNKLVGIEPKTFRVGVGHLVTYETYFRNQKGELCMTDRRTVFRYREGTGEGYEATKQ